MARHGPTITMATPAPKQIYNVKICMVALIASMGAIIFGYDLAFIGTTITLPSFQKRFGLDGLSQTEQDGFSANVVSLLQVGCIIGAIIGPTLSERFGRKPALMISGLLFSIGSLIQTLCFGNWAALFLGRCIGGIGVGAASGLVPLYLAELSPPNIRGALVGTYEIAVQTGTCLGFWINFLVQKTMSPTDGQWILPFALQLVPGVLLILGLLFVPESPRWLAQHSDQAKAFRQLAKFRKLEDDHPYIIEEWNFILTQVHETTMNETHRTPKQMIRGLLRPDMRRRIIIVTLLFTFMQFAGSNAINYYSPRVFKSIGLSGTSTVLFTTGIYGIVRLVAVIIAMFFIVDRFGRRPMLLAGCVVMGFSMWYLGSYAKISPAIAGKHTDAGGYSAAVMIYIFAVGFCFSMAGVPWIYCSEIFPAEFRHIGMAIGTTVHWSMNFVIARSVPYMFTNIGFGTYFVFAACITLCIPFVYFFLPETKGLTLEQMDGLFGRAVTITSVEEGGQGITINEEVVDKGSSEHIEKLG